MFDVGFQEIVLISVIALLVIGPERLPAVARKVGLYVGKMQRFVAGVKSDIQSELKADELRSLLNSQEDQIRELKSMVDETRSDIAKTARTATDAISQGMDTATGQVRDAAEAARENNAKMEQIAKSAGYGYGDDAKTAQAEASANGGADAEPSAQVSDSSDPPDGSGGKDAGN